MNPKRPTHGGCARCAQLASRPRTLCQRTAAPVCKKDFQGSERLFVLVRVLFRLWTLGSLSNMVGRVVVSFAQSAKRPAGLCVVVVCSATSHFIVRFQWRGYVWWLCCATALWLVLVSAFGAAVALWFCRVWSASWLLVWFCVAAFGKCLRACLHCAAVLWYSGMTERFQGSEVDVACLCIRACSSFLSWLLYNISSASHTHTHKLEAGMHASRRCMHVTARLWWV